MVLDLSSLEADNASSAFFTGAELQATSFKLQGKPAQTLISGTQCSRTPDCKWWQLAILAL